MYRINDSTVRTIQMHHWVDQVVIILLFSSATKVKIRANDYILKHVHNGRNIAPSNKSDIEVLIIESIMALPALDRGLIRRKIVLPHIWFAAYQDSLMNILWISYVFQEVIGHELRKNFHILLLVVKLIQIINWSLILDLYGNFVLLIGFTFEFWFLALVGFVDYWQEESVVFKHYDKLLFVFVQSNLWVPVAFKWILCVFGSK